MLVGFYDGMTPRLITQWNKAGTIWYHHLSTKEGAVNRICFIPTSSERYLIHDRIIPVPGQLCRFQIIRHRVNGALDYEIQAAEIQVKLSEIRYLKFITQNFTSEILAILKYRISSFKRRPLIKAALQ